MTDREAYDILELQYGEPPEAIKKAYRRLALKYHPDRNKGSKEAEEKFKKINNAYEYLSEFNEYAGEATTNASPHQSQDAKTADTSGASFAHHHNYHERYKHGEFGEHEFKKRAS